MAQRNMSLVRLSASRLKTLSDCSWIYWCKYILKLEDESNDGARRGTVTHLILECLLKKKGGRLATKRKKIYNKIIKYGLEKIPSIIRLIKKSMKKEGIVTEEDNKGNNNYELIKEMIMIGLTSDFFCNDKKRARQLLPEEHFDYIRKVNGDSIYHINGFIDKVAIYNKKDKQKIVDYKTNQEKFEIKELEENIQARMYALYNLRIRNAMSIVTFLFLRHTPPDQTLEFTERELKEFEEYLIYMTEYLEDFDIRKALSNYAWDKGFAEEGEGFVGRIKCMPACKVKGQLKKDGQKMWCCPFKWEYDYWAEYDDEGKLVKGHLVKPKKTKIGHSVMKLNYKGCPKINGGKVTEVYKPIVGDF